MSLRPIIALLICSATIFFSCKKDQPVEEPDFGYDYFPDTQGHFVIYDCDSTVVTQITHDTLHYIFQIKEKIDSQFTDNEGRPAFRIARYKKLLQINDSVYSNPQWQIQDVWWGNKTKTTAEVVEENIRYVKLVFPGEEGKSWNGNAQNTIGTWDYEYITYDEPLTLGTLSFDKCAHVEQYDSKGVVIYKKLYDEIYARNVGMVKKEITDYTWQYQNGLPVIGKIDYGFHYVMTAIQHGTE